MSAQRRHTTLVLCCGMARLARQSNYRSIVYLNLNFVYMSWHKVDELIEEMEIFVCRLFAFELNLFFIVKLPTKHLHNSQR